MKIDKEKIIIDLVYLWVDGSDPVWLAKRNAFIGDAETTSSANCEGRYINNDELKFSLRSVEKYASWINKIYIITDNQTPDWIDWTNPKIKRVDHKDIMPEEILPCYNSGVIELFLYKIEGLSEHFIYANDDMLINRSVSPDTFFTDEGFPVVRLTRKRFRRLRWFWREEIRKKPLHNYSKSIKTASELVKQKYGIYYSGMPHHNIDAYLKSDCRRMAEKVFKTEFEAMHYNRLRSPEDIERIVFSYVALAEKRGVLHYCSKKESLYIHIHKDRHYKNLGKYNPIFFCMNDSQYAQDSDRRKSTLFLNKLFPEKSQFEK
ncbi:MAG: glycosyltransferase [Bacteroidetes bacterium]|nr:glycosyltransferase [Bacteroidota bacterium]